MKKFIKEQTQNSLIYQGLKISVKGQKQNYCFKKISTQIGVHVEHAWVRNVCIVF